MSKQHFRGGQRRTLEAGCGWKTCGHPQEVNKKWEIHRRYCLNCMNSQQREMPEFDKTAGLMNGWKGVDNNNQKHKKMLTTAYINGERNDILVDGVSTLHQAMDRTKLTASLIAEEEGIGENFNCLSRSQKKRMRKKFAKDKAKIEEEEEFIAKFVV